MSSHRGFTLLELVIGMGIFSLLALGTAWILISALRSNSVIWEQLQTQSEGRRALREVVDTVRRAESSSLGAYPIETVDPYELTLYANIDSDTLRERVRFFVSTTANLFQQGTIKPTGTPLQYNVNDEVITTLATAVVNDDNGVPVFSYFDESYTGTQTPLASPVTTTAVHVIRIQLELEKDPTATPVPLHVESTVHVRNLKTN